MLIILPIMRYICLFVGGVCFLLNILYMALLVSNCVFVRIDAYQKSINGFNKLTSLQVKEQLLEYCITSLFP